MRKSLEKPIENAILAYLNFSGILAWKNQTVGIYDPVKKIYRKSRNIYHISGVSDILGVLPDGIFLAIEVKVEKINSKGKKIKTYPSREQQEFPSIQYYQD